MNHCLLGPVHYRHPTEDSYVLTIDRTLPLPPGHTLLNLTERLLIVRAPWKSSLPTVDHSVAKFIASKFGAGMNGNLDYLDVFVLSTSAYSRTLTLSPLDLR
jgi:hypothetical protein